jgi:multidrug efflux pump
MAKILDQTLPRGMAYEWTDLAYQQLISGNTAFLVFPLCVLFVFLVLAAQYESLSLPLAIVLIVPMCLLPAITAVRFDHGDNNIFMQIGLLVLVGLACKNAILIVEFAKHLQEDRGRDARAAVLEAAHLRLRPILMGVVPLALATGAGAEVRHALGVTVFAGMLGVTAFGLLLTPVFYVLVRRATARLNATRTTTAQGAADAPLAPLPAPEGSHD